MNEENRIKMLQDKIERNKKFYAESINDLVDKNTKLLTLCAFYKFDYLLRTNSLPKEALDAYKRNNVENNRYNVIIELRKQFEAFNNEELVPIEVKYIMKELLENE